MTHSESLKEFAPAMAKAQAVMKGAPRDHTNPAFPRSRYADLASVWDACREALTSNGFSVLQMPSADGNAVTITTMLLHSSGEWMAEPLTMTAKDAGPQSIGSAITYGRRYGLMAAVGICPEDDDGEAATDHHAPPQQQQQQYPGQQRQHQGGSNHHDSNRPPTTGKQLFAWTKAQEEKHQVGMLKYLNSWAKLQDFPGRMVDFSPEQVALAHAEAVRKLHSIEAAGDPEEEALAN